MSKFAKFSGAIAKKFWKAYVYDGDAAAAEKDAAVVFKARSSTIVTVFNLSARDLTLLAKEVADRQPDYATAPGKPFTTKRPYRFWQRKGEEVLPGGPRKFRYKVKQDGDVFKVFQLAGLG